MFLTVYLEGIFLWKEKDKPLKYNQNKLMQEIARLKMYEENHQACGAKFKLDETIEFIRFCHDNRM